MLLLICTSVYSQDKTYTNEEKKIIDLIIKETRFFLDRNFEDWSECWLHEPFCRHYFMGQDFCNTYNGWEGILEGFDRHFKGKPMENFDIQKCNFEIEVFQDVAFAHYTEKYITTTKNEVSIGTGKNNAVFLRDNGKWKFVTMNIAYVSNYD